LKGEAASSIPVEQPDKFDLLVNLKTAKVIPASVLLRADEVIE
jgi:putative ABC transport system substrate-binding protein